MGRKGKKENISFRKYTREEMKEERYGNLYIQLVIKGGKAKVSMHNPYWALTAQHTWAPRMMELGEVRLSYEDWKDALTYFLSNVLQRRIVEEEAVDRRMGLTYPDDPEKLGLEDEEFTEALKAWMDEITLEEGKGYDLFLAWEIWDNGEHHFSPNRSAYRRWNPIPYETPLEETKEEKEGE